MGIVDGTLKRFKASLHFNDKDASFDMKYTPLSAGFLFTVFDFLQASFPYET